MHKRAVASHGVGSKPLGHSCCCFATNACAGEPSTLAGGFHATAQETNPQPLRVLLSSSCVTPASWESLGICSCMFAHGPTAQAHANPFPLVNGLEVTLQSTSKNERSAIDTAIQEIVSNGTDKLDYICSIPAFFAFWCVLVSEWCVVVRFGLRMVRVGAFWCVLVRLGAC